MCASRSAEYQSWEKVSEGYVISSFAPIVEKVWYETGDPNGCLYGRCGNNYAYYLNNCNCRQGHWNTGTHASGYPSCPHGYIVEHEQRSRAHCYNDSGYNKLGYRAPCGRTTHTEGEKWGYVTRTRTTTCAEETVSVDHAHQSRS